MNRRDDDIGSATDAQGDRIRQTLIALRRRKQEKPFDDLFDDLFNEIQGYSNGTLSPADGESAAELLKSALEKADAILKPATAIPTAPQAGPSGQPQETPSQAQTPYTEQNPEAVLKDIKNGRVRTAPDHERLSKAAEKLQGRLLVEALSSLGWKLPEGLHKFKAHANLRRLAYEKLEGLDLIEAFCTLSKTDPGTIRSINPQDHETLRRHAENISDSKDVSSALSWLSKFPPDDEKVAAHADLRAIAGAKLKGEDLTSALVDLSLNFPHQLGKENKKQAFSHIRDIAAEHLDQEQRLKVERAIRTRNPPVFSMSGPSIISRVARGR